MTMAEWMICLDAGGNGEGPVFSGPKDKAVWSLYADQGPRLADVKAKSGPHFGERGMWLYSSGTSYPRAMDTARTLGLTGTPIGSETASSS
jgi:hypothetical protein